NLAVSKTMTVTSTYDHRVIQGAGSGEFLRTVHNLLLGEDDFYDEIFVNLRIPTTPIRWAPDVQVNPEDEVGKAPNSAADPFVSGTGSPDRCHGSTGIPYAYPP